FVDHLAAGIEDFELHPADDLARLLIISDRRAARGIFPSEGRVALGPSAIADNALLDWTARNQHRAACQRLRSQRAQRAHVIDHPDAAAMRRKYEVVFALLQCDVADGYSVREVVGLE